MGPNLNQSMSDEELWVNAQLPLSDDEVALYEEVFDELKIKDNENCFKFKIHGGGGRETKLESEECDKEKAVACYVRCGKENTIIGRKKGNKIAINFHLLLHVDSAVSLCPAPHFFAYDGGARCCDSETSTSCGGDSSSRSCPGTTCVDGRKTY